jgi:hypothetical protein
MLKTFQTLFSSPKASLKLFLSFTIHPNSPHDMYIGKVALILFPFISPWHYANWIFGSYRIFYKILSGVIHLLKIA